MLKIKLIAMGKLTEKFYRESAEEYLTRIKKHYSLSVVELKPEPLSQNPSQAEISSALEREEKKIRAEIAPRSAVVALCVEGVQKTSEGFSEMLSDYALSGISEVVFIVGSSFGMSEGIKKSADVRLSFSKMTLPHELFRVCLLEQIYRAGEIASGGKYHK